MSLHIQGQIQWRANQVCAVYGSFWVGLYIVLLHTCRPSNWKGKATLLSFVNLTLYYRKAKLPPILCVQLCHLACCNLTRLTIMEITQLYNLFCYHSSILRSLTPYSRMIILLLGGPANSSTSALLTYRRKSVDSLIVLFLFRQKLLGKRVFLSVIVYKHAIRASVRRYHECTCFFCSSDCMQRLSSFWPHQKVRCTAVAVLQVRNFSLWVKLKPEERVSCLHGVHDTIRPPPAREDSVY